MTSELERLDADIRHLGYLTVQQATVLQRLEADAVVARRQLDLYDRQLDRLRDTRDRLQAAPIKEAAASLATSGRLTHREDTSNEQHEDY